MTEKILIDNNQIVDICVACQKQLAFYGYLNYAEPLYYSTIAIQLKHKPELKICKHCGSFFTSNIIPEQDSIWLYSKSNSTERWEAKPFVKDKTALLLRTFKKYLMPSTRLLDYGCNYGLLLDFAKEKGAQTYGLEYSEKSVEIIKQKGHIHVSDITAYNQFFDIITAFDVIEHIYDLKMFFSQCKQALKTGGYLIVLTGNPESIGAKWAKNNWWYYNFPEHINFLSKRFFNYLSAEFEMVDYRKVFNSNNFKTANYNPVAWIQFKKLLFQSKNQKPYNGLPSLLPDHHLIVFKKQ